MFRIHHTLRVFVNGSGGSAAAAEIRVLIKENERDDLDRLQHLCYCWPAGGKAEHHLPVPMLRIKAGGWAF